MNIEFKGKCRSSIEQHVVLRVLSTKNLSVFETLMSSL